MNRYRLTAVFSAFTALLSLLFLCNLCFGTVRIPLEEVLSILTGGASDKESWYVIVRQSRLPSAVTALLAGSSLACSGLLLQTVFRNPLAGPDILGVNGGAGLGVACVMLVLGGNITAGAMTLGNTLSIMAGAFAGALAVSGLILILSAKLRNPAMLLIAGIMVSYLASSAISLLNFFSTAEGVQSYMMWGMGSFNNVTTERLPLFCMVIAAGLVISLALVKKLNVMLLGDYYAENLGVNINRTRTLLLLSTCMMVAADTAMCGPVSFIGLAVPHIARLILKDNNHRILMPVTILTGAAIALLCNLLCTLPGDNGLIPLNAVTPVIGAPVVLYVLLCEYRSMNRG